MLQRVYLISCPNPDCGDTIVLPRQSPLGIFEHPQRRPTDEWPIDYLCSYCGQLFSLPAEEIRLEGVETLGQMPLSETLRQYEFSNDHRHSPRFYRIYSKALSRVSEETLIEGMLKPTGKWEPEHGEPHFVGVTQLLH